jgi:signal transduction histidine kinase
VAEGSGIGSTGGGALPDGLEFVAAEQAGLRRVATLVAQAAPSQAVFDAVCEETGRIVGATTVNLAHFTNDGVNVTMSGWSLRGVHVPTGTHLPLEGDSINEIVRRTGRPARVDSYDGVSGPLAARLRELGVRSELGAPVVVDGQVWGALIAGTDKPEPMPAGTEDRLARFAELIATAIANAATHAELVASRARIVTATQEARRRLARDLHDGAQQRLVVTIIALQLADERFEQDPPAARVLLREALAHARNGLADLRELAAGVHPGVLTTRGLRAAIDALAHRSPLPVDVDVPEGRHPPHVEAAAYFVVAEALTNAVKHAEAAHAEVRIIERDGSLDVRVEDDGKGGADAGGGGLRGLTDRVQALGGTVEIVSPPGGGTGLHACISLAAPPEGPDAPLR